MARSDVSAVLIGLTTFLLCAGGPARGDLVSNGNFESYTPGPLGPGDLVYSPVLGWSSPALDAAGSRTGNLLFTPGSADTTGVYYLNVNNASAYFGLWGPNNGVNNGLPATSPTGGNFIGLDADPLFNGALSQTLTGLVAGLTYRVTFYWATAQLWTTSGPTTAQLQVSFGSQTQSTVVLNTPSQGFNPWRQQSFDFKADGVSEVLSFLAVGTPSGLPPFVLLDGVTAAAVPEPSVLMLAGVSILTAGLVRLARRRLARAR